MQNIFLVVGSCHECIILHTSSSVLELTCGTNIECWSPSGMLYVCQVIGVAGNILELSSVVSNGHPVECVPVGSFLAIGTLAAPWFIKQYYAGKYNAMIATVMGGYGIVDYELPNRKKVALFGQ